MATVAEIDGELKELKKRASELQEKIDDLDAKKRAKMTLFERIGGDQSLASSQSKKEDEQAAKDIARIEAAIEGATKPHPYHPNGCRWVEVRASDNPKVYDHFVGQHFRIKAYKKFIGCGDDDPWDPCDCSICNSNKKTKMWGIEW